MVSSGKLTDNWQFLQVQLVKANFSARLLYPEPDSTAPVDFEWLSGVTRVLRRNLRPKLY